MKLTSIALEQPVQSTITLPGYQITEQLYTGSRTLVYRAICVENQQPVVIKLLTNEHPSFSELVQFRNQYTIAKNLKIPGIIQPYSLEPHGNAYALVMEDFGGTSLQHFANGRSLPLKQFFEIALQLVEILHPLHQQRVIHKDIKPANILIQPETMQVKLIDFSISSLLPRETQEIKNPNGLEGTLAYLSPEQTGRMNRGIDYRSDFYSLGVTFYELLTGQLPFQSDDPLELVHCHIAKQPPVVHCVKPDSPSMLSAMIGKLMAKNAEDRYQSALGLKHDLENCCIQWQETGNIEPFELGERDLCDRFVIPEKLYGREAEVTTLLAAFERVSGTQEPDATCQLSPLTAHRAARSELILVTGFSGVGKTAIVNEVHKPIVRQRGYFIKGKYDQFQRNIPFSAFVQAFRDLMGQLLSESDIELEQWKNKILTALGENGQVMIEVIPELEQVIGKQPSVVELSGNAAQHRFNHLLQQFIRVFTTPEHPLVLFIDDLQWADSASLNLMQVLMSEAETRYLLLIGAYRDNEVSSAHPLMLTLADVRKANAIVNTIALEPLDHRSVNQLIADTLSCPLALAFPLTDLVMGKTKGNPFFTTQFLKALHEEGFIPFNVDGNYWECDVAAVRSLALTDDVVEFMALQLQKLPSDTQDILKLAACIGAQFDLTTLSIIVKQSQTEVATTLWKALQEGLILPQSDIYKFYQDTAHIPHSAPHTPHQCSYKFLHDRVQQAAYSLIPDDQKQITHLTIGQLLLSNTPIEAQSENLFEIVNQLNIGRTLITQRSLKLELAELNLKVGHKAKSATAHAAALEYYTTGIALLAEDRWHTDYELTLALYAAATEAAYLSGEFEQMEPFMAAILKQARTLLDTVKVYELQIQAAHAQNQLLESVQIALKLLKLLEITFPEQPTEQDSAAAMTATIALVAGRNPLDLMALPQMSDAYTLAAIRVLGAVTPCAYVSAPALVPLLILEQVKRSIHYGNAPSSAFGYACYGMVLCGSGNIDTGHQFGQLALHLFDQFDAKELKASIHGQVYVTVWHWKEPVRSTWTPLRDAYQSGLDAGDLTWASIAACVYIQHTYFGGKALTDLREEVAAFSVQLAQIKQEALLNQVRIFQQSLLNLLDDAVQPQELTGEVFKEEQMLPVLEQSNDQVGLCYFYGAKLFLGYLFEDWETAIAAAIANEAYIGAATGLFVVPVFYTYDSLAHLAFYAQVDEAEQPKVLERVAANQKKLKPWADHAPMNHLHKFYLVEAERCRVLGQKAEAIDLYDRAIALATEHEYIQEAAIANELAAKFYLEWGKERIAQEYMTEAYYGYARWGAKAKIVDLETRYPQLLVSILQQPRPSFNSHDTIVAIKRVEVSPSSGASSGTTSISAHLDLDTILKASQALSSEIELDKLMMALLNIVIENAGAEKCVLLLVTNDQLKVEAIAQVNQAATVLQSIPLADSQAVPIKLIHTVKRSLQPAVIIDATNFSSLAADPYICEQQPKSILCTPILNQGKLLGILYVENNQCAGAFTRDRVELLNLLCAQAAISLENVRLYQQIQRSLEDAKLMQFSIDRVTTPVCWVEPDGHISYANDAFCGDLGYSQEEILGKYVYDFSPDFSKEGWSDHWQSIRQQGSATFESKLRNCEGICHPVEVTINHITFHEKEYHLTFLVNISDRKRAEMALQDSEANVRLMVESIQDYAIIRLKPDGTVATWNVGAEHTKGYTADEIIGQHFSVFYTPEDIAHNLPQQVLQIAIRQGKYEEEGWRTRKDGSRFWANVDITALWDAEGHLRGFSKVSHDITERKQAQDLLQQSEAELRQRTLVLENTLSQLQSTQMQLVQSEKMSALGNLVAGVAHEINNPLGFLNGNIQPALDYVKDLFGLIDLYQQEYPHPTVAIQAEIDEIDLDYIREDLPKLVGSMREGVNRIRSISTSLRTFSRADKDHKVPFNIHDGIDSTILILKHRLKANESRPEIEVVTNYGSIPPITCFPGQLNQVFMNILANAIDALEEASQDHSFTDIQAKPNQIEIQTQLNDTENQVMIQIRDNGVGMSDDVKQRVFDHLFTTKAVGQGTGLGLAITQQIVVEKHGGAIAVESAIDQGTLLTISLPR